VTQVEELKLILGLLPIGATTIIFSAVYAQMSTLFVEQGSTMDRSVGSIFEIPAASLSMFDTLSVIIWVPIYDVIIIPIARRFTGHQLGFSQLQRMGIGLIISTLSMVVAAIVEVKRLETAKEYGLLEDTDTPVPMSVFWQVPQYVLIGASEVFTFIGQLEFYYDQSPDATRSLCAAIALLSTALGNYLSAFILFVITSVTGDPGWIPDNLNIGHIDYVFWLLAGLSLLNFFVFMAFARSYTYKKVGKA
jgi:peptide/histidine transporter 3/4